MIDREYRTSHPCLPHPYYEQVAHADRNRRPRRRNERPASNPRVWERRREGSECVKMSACFVLSTFYHLWWRKRGCGRTRTRLLVTLRRKRHPPCRLDRTVGEIKWVHDLFSIKNQNLNLIIFHFGKLVLIISLDAALRLCRLTHSITHVLGEPCTCVDMRVVDPHTLLQPPLSLLISHILYLPVPTKIEQKKPILCTRLSRCV